MTEAALEAAEQFPHKRLIFYYMQPHYLFVSAETDFDKNHLRQIDRDDGDPSGENVWNQKFTGKLDTSLEKLWSVYADNLKYILKHVGNLLDKISGKTVVTADHGNYVEERASPIPIQEWGHPRGLYDAPVVRVPWFEHTSGKRRDIHEGTSSANDSHIGSDVVSDRLRNLGYKQ